MTDDTLNQEIADILRQDDREGTRKIPQAKVNRLTLAMLADIRETQTEQGKRIKKVEDTSIVLWVTNNKALAALSFLAALLLDAFGAGKYMLKAALKYAGIDLPELP